MSLSDKDCLIGKQFDSGVTSDSSDSIKQSLKNPKKQFDQRRRRRIPKLGITIKQNPDLSFIRSVPLPRCVSCDSPLFQRQPLVKTNGILFMNAREKEATNNRVYISVHDCAFTRSNIVADWSDELKDHQDFCQQQIEIAVRLQRDLYKQQRLDSSPDPEVMSIEDVPLEPALNPIQAARQISPNYGYQNFSKKVKLSSWHEPMDVDAPAPVLQRANSRRSSKMDFGIKFRKMKSKVQNTMQKALPANAGNTSTINGIENNFEPPTSARSKTSHPKKFFQDDVEINFIGKLQSTVLRQHCGNCVLKDKPDEFQSVLFVCEL